MAKCFLKLLKINNLEINFNSLNNINCILSILY